jgi:hypothetical protein
LLECPTCNPSLTRQGAGRPECLDLREFDRERTSQIALIPTVRLIRQNF